MNIHGAVALSLLSAASVSTNAVAQTDAKLSLKIKPLAESLCITHDADAAAEFRAGKLYLEETRYLQRTDPEMLEQLRICALETGLCAEKNAPLARRVLEDDGSLAGYLRVKAPKRLQRILTCAEEAASQNDDRNPGNSYSGETQLDALFDGARGGKKQAPAPENEPDNKNPDLHSPPEKSVAAYDPGQRATELMRAGAYGESLSMSDEALKRFPLSPFRYYWLIVKGAVLSAINRNHAAKDVYESILRDNPDTVWCADAQLYLGLLEESCTPASAAYFTAAVGCPDRPEGSWVKERAAKELASCGNP